MTKLTKEQWIERFNLIHFNRYDYSKFIYKNNHTNVCIICLEHGEFWQTPKKHLIGHGCPKCGRSLPLSIEIFIQKANNKHNNFYIYDNTIYKNTNTKICIICPEHGEFWQTPHNHLAGHGCPICGGTSLLNTEEFIKKAILVHENKFNYDKVQYKNNETKVCIICPEHGEFWQTPYNHLSGFGCSFCVKSKGIIEIIKQLKDFNINIITEYRFENCKDKNSLPFDIYLPNYNICIEYDGEQHFEPIRFNGISLEKAKEIFERTKKHDTIKNNYCKENNIQLIRIPYWNKNLIKEILKEINYVI